MTSCCTRAVRGTILPGQSQERPCTGITGAPISSRRDSRLLKVDGLDLHVTDLDAIDGSPVYDLAPYFKEMGPRGG